MSGSRLLDLAFERDSLAELDPAARRLALRDLVHDHANEDDARRLLERLADTIDGFGPLTELMRDPSITDVLVNGPDEVWVEKRGHLERTPVAFEGLAALEAFIDRFVSTASTRVDASSPLGDARLPDGSRIHVVLPPIASKPLVSIRRFPDRPMDMDDLVATSMLDRASAERLTAWVRERRNILISGRTGTGKTTLLNALLAEIAADERVVLIEETTELQPVDIHVVGLAARGPNVEGAGTVDLDALVRAALRMRPDRIVIGEVRGREALMALDALSTGHEGSLLTIHGRSCADALDRVASLASRASPAERLVGLRERVGSIFDVIVQLDRGPNGGRRLVEMRAGRDR
jgi:pilus assembly protein CpaF